VYNEVAQRRERVMIGYSLSIPIGKFLNLAPQVNIALNNVTVQTNIPRELNVEDQDGIGTEYVFSWLENQNNGNQNSVVYWANQGNQYWRRLRLKEAVESYDKALEIDPEFYPVWYGKGLVRTFEGNYQEALGNYNRAITILDKQIAQFPRETERQEMRNSVVKLRDKIQPFVANSPTTPTTPTVNSPAPPTQPESTVQPSPSSPPPDPNITPPQPQPETQPETQPGWLW
jgi:tetratricopeptide (TPR) repeat protein